MIVNKMTVDGSEYFLAEEQSVEEAKHRVVDAVQQGGGLVDLKIAGHENVSVLVSQSIAVTFETIEATEPVENRADDIWDWDDFTFLAS